MFERFLKKNLDLKILSLTLSTLLWLIVHLTQSAVGIGQNDSHLQVPLMVENLAPNLQVESPPANVSITVKGIHKSLDGIKASDFKASVDLDGRGPATYKDLPVHVASPIGYVVTDISPAKVEVVVDARSDKTVPVTWEFEGGKDPGKIVVMPREVAVMGPKALVERVVAAQIHVPNFDETSGLLQDLTPTPIDILSRPVVGPVVSPATVHVTGERMNNLKPVAVRPNIVGKLGKDNELEAVSVNPSVVLIEMISGQRDIDHLDTAPIDISGSNGTTVRKVKLILPAGVRARGGPDVTVIILIGKRT